MVTILKTTFTKMTKHANIAQKIQVAILADVGYYNNYIAEMTSLSYCQVGRENEFKYKYIIFIG